MIGATETRNARAKALVDALFLDWYGAAVRFAYREVGSRETAEDIVQEAFIELYRALLRGQAIENLRGWTLCVVRRSIIDRRRWQERHGGVLLPLMAADRLRDPSGSASWSGKDDRLSRLLALLSRREEEVVLLRASGLKYGQIATQLKISGNSVKTLLARAIRKMRQSKLSGASRPTANCL